MCPSPFNRMYEGYAFPKSPNVYDRLGDKPEYQRAWAGESLYEDKEALSMRHQYYFGCNSFIDGEIGRVADAAERYAPDAVVIYTSDHGDFLHSHSLSGKGPAAYDEITRVPLIIAGGNTTENRVPGGRATGGPAPGSRVPGGRAPNARIPAGTVCRNPVSHINLAPTILELMGHKPPKTMEGQSLLRELEDPSVRTNDCIFMEFGRYEVDHDSFGGLQLMRTIYDGRYKLSVNLLSGDELYDLNDDPYEMVNLININGREAARDRLHDRLLAHMNETRDPFRGYYWERRPWRADAAPATWPYTSMTRQREEESIYEKRQLDYNTGLDMTEAVRKK